MARSKRAIEGSDVIPKGFPVLVNEKLEIIESLFDYLLEIATLHGRTASPLTVKAYAEHLMDWFDSLEQSGIDWTVVTQETLANYRLRLRLRLAVLVRFRDHYLPRREHWLMAHRPVSVRPRFPEIYRTESEAD